MLTACSDRRYSSVYYELLNGILIPLPFCLASLAFSTGTPSVSNGSFTFSSVAKYFHALPDGTVDLAADASGGIYVPLLEASWLTALTLLVLGAVARWIHSDSQADRNDENFVSQLVAGFSISSLKSLLSPRMVTGILGVHLPFLAALQLGGLRTGLLLLLAFSSGITNLMTWTATGLDLTLLWRGMLRRKFSCLCLALTMAADAAGLTAGLPRLQLLSGYLAIFASLPFLPFRTYSGVSTPASGTATLASTFRLRSWVSSSKPAPSSPTPLLTTAQSRIQTIVAGLLLLAGTVALSLLFPSTLRLKDNALQLSVLSVACTAALVFLAQPSVLQSSTKLGVASGCVVIVLFDCINHWSSSWKIPIICSIWPGSAYLAALFDSVDISNLNIFGHSHHAHSNGRHTLAEHAKHSRFTTFLLSYTSPGSIMHSILIDRDSRRIFYFAWYDAVNRCRGSG